MMKWKTNLSSFGRNYSFALLLLALLSAHLPFLSADPDLNISFSRGPFTDEGLNTVQVRNWINHGELDLAECDNLLKTPLFGLSLILPYKVFGTSHLVSRLHVLLLLLLTLFLIGKDPKHKITVGVLILISFFQYQVFHFSHFSLAEILSSAAVLLCIHFLARSADIQYNARLRRNNAILSAVFLSLSYFFKIQFIYLVLLLPIVHLGILSQKLPLSRKSFIRQGFYSSATLLFFLMIYLFGWYLPNKDLYDHMMSGQSGEFTISNKVLEYLEFNLSNFIFTGWFLAFIILFILAAGTGFYLLRKNPSSRFPVLFIASFVWFLLETHKLLMVYLPTRYRISLYISVGLLISTVIGEIIVKKRNRNTKGFPGWIHPVSLIAAAILISINILNYSRSFYGRSFNIRDANQYLSATVKPEDVVLGSWAPSLTWQAKAKAIPVWNNFLNYQDPVNSYKPRVIISEPDEQDSEQAYKSQNISLMQLSDSSRTVSIGQWQVTIYWLN